MMKIKADPGTVSVIMPVYNGEKTVEESVSSVLAQTYGDIELIIADDASTDNTPEICRVLAGKDSRIRIIDNQANSGALASRLKAAKMAKGEWIAFIDADDLWHTEKLEKQIRLRDDSGCDLVYTASAFIDGDGNKYKWIMHVPDKVGYRRLLKQNIISNSSVLVRRDDFIKYASPSDKIRDMHEDFACWLSMLRDGLTACGVNEPLIIYRISKRSKSGNKMNAYAMYMKTYGYLGLGFFERCFYQACYSVNGLVKYSHFR